MGAWDDEPGRALTEAAAGLARNGSGDATVTVGHVTAHIRDVDVSVGVLRVRLGLTDEGPSLKAARVLVLRSSDDHLRAPNPAPRVAP
jgi:hypothetical protein